MTTVYVNTTKEYQTIYTFNRKHGENLRFNVVMRGVVGGSLMLKSVSGGVAYISETVPLDEFNCALFNGLLDSAELTSYFANGNDELVLVTELQHTDVNGNVYKSMDITFNIKSSNI